MRTILYGHFESCPARFHELEAWVLWYRAWHEFDSWEVFWGAGVMTKEEFEKDWARTYPAGLPPLPPHAFAANGC
jgi:hypothetical protein